MVSLAEVSAGRWYEITNVNLSTSYWAFNIWDNGVVVGSNYSYGSGYRYNSPFDMPLFTKSTTISSLTGIPLLTAPTPTTATIYIDSTGGGQILIDGVTAPSQVVRSIGSVITFTAKPISGYAFQKWQVYVNNALFKEYTTNPVTLTVDRNYSVTGVFIQDQNALCCPDGWTIDSTGICNSPSGEGAEPPHYCSLGGIPVSQTPPTQPLFKILTVGFGKAIQGQPMSEVSSCNIAWDEVKEAGIVAIVKTENSVKGQYIKLKLYCTINTIHYFFIVNYLQEPTMYIPLSSAGSFLDYEPNTIYSALNVEVIL